jgi:hypothetical protein
MTHSHQTTNLHDARVYHKLTVAQGKAWCLPGKLGEDVRRKMAAQLARMYPQNGCGICSAAMSLVAHVTPRGELRLLVAPFRTIPISAIANKPQTTECPCLEFWDPEVKGPWRFRSEEERRRHGGHHPMCQYQRTSSQVFATMFQAMNGGVEIDDKGIARRTRGNTQKTRVRPDLMLQVQRKLTGG